MRARNVLLLLVAGLLPVASLSYNEQLVWKSPPAGKADITTLLRAICPDTFDPAVPACKPCPEYTMGGKEFSLNAILFGSFTKSGVEEAIANSVGCEAHAHAFAGSILLRKEHGSWSFEEYIQAMNTSACALYHLKTGRELLICEGGNCFMGACLQSIILADLALQENDRFKSVIDVRDDSGTSPCNTVSGSIDKAAWHNLAGHQSPVLTVWVTAGRSDAPGGSSDTCRDVIPRKETRHYQLDFEYQSTSGDFQPTPSSRGQFEDFQGFNSQWK